MTPEQQTPTINDLISRADALAGIRKQMGEGDEPWMKGNNSAIAACAATIRALPAYEVWVRELEWVDFKDRGAKAQAWNAANYMIQKWSDGRYEISASYPGYSNSIAGIDRYYPSIEAAKAAAQADYAARIRSALTTAPAADVAGLREALKPFADIGIGSDPDYQPTIRMDRAAIISARAAIEAHAASTESPINWRDDPVAIVEDDEPMIGRGYE